MIDLFSVVKDSLPNNTSLTKEPFRVRLSDSLYFMSRFNGFVFNLRTILPDGSSHEEMLFVSEVADTNFHDAISLFGKSVEELCNRCYWVDENDIVKLVFTV